MHHISNWSLGLFPVYDTWYHGLWYTIPPIYLTGEEPQHSYHILLSICRFGNAEVLSLYFVHCCVNTPSYNQVYYIKCFICFTCNFLTSIVFWLFKIQIGFLHERLNHRILRLDGESPLPSKILVIIINTGLNDLILLFSILVDIGSSTHETLKCLATIFRIVFT